MTALLLENIKLVVLFLLIATVIALSHFSEATPSRPKMRRSPRKAAPAAL